LEEADLKGVDMSNSYLGGADLSRSKFDLSNINLSGGVYNRETKWPDTFDFDLGELGLILE
jgi:uncharacterized protein YjbI with pentapeptide repeats